MTTFPDAPGRNGPVRNGGYNEVWSSGTEIPNDIYMQSEAEEWLDIAAKDPHRSGNLTDILSGSYSPGWLQGGPVTPGSSWSDCMDLDDAAGDSHSEDISVATPPTLTTGSSVDHGGDSDDDVQMTDSSPQSPHPHNVWPTLSEYQPPLKQTIEFNTSSPSSDSSISLSSESLSGSSASSPSRSSSGSDTSTSLSNISTPYHPSSNNEPRGRVLKAPEETNEVRKIGACYRCRISRVKCDTSPVCRKCFVDVSKVPGGDFMRKTCIRDEPSKVGGVSASRWSWKVSRINPRRDDFAENRIKLRVRFPSEDPMSRGLEIIAAPFTVPGNSSNRKLFGVLPDEGPKVDDIATWIKAQITSEEKNDFESWLEKLHLRFFQSSCLDSAVKSDERTAKMEGKPTPKKEPWKIKDMQKELLKNILSMRCMWKVWSCEKFEIRAANGSPLPSDWDISAIGDHIQRVAEQELSSLEKRILRDMDRYLSPLEVREDRPVLKSAMNVASWIILWQMILLYRQSVIRTLDQQERDQKEVNAAPFVLGMSPSAKRHKFHEVTERLFQGVVVMYSETFRTRKVLEGLRDANESVFGNDASLHNVFKETWKAREKFYKHVEANRQSPDTDPLLASLVPVKERAAFKKGRGHK